MAFLLTHSTVASMDGRLFTIEYLKSLLPQNIKENQAKAKSEVEETSNIKILTWFT
jgi:hypothetical protein